MSADQKKSVAASCLVCTLPLWLAFQVFEAFPGITVVVLWWGLAIASLSLYAMAESQAVVRRARITQLFGACLNATVVLANGGRMPVVGSSHSSGVWKMADGSERLLWLADYKSMWFFSAGDFVIIVGGLATIFLILYRKRAKA